MKPLTGATLVVFFSFLALAPPPSEAPTGFDNKSNGTVDDATHTADQAKFEEVEAVADGLGPLYNAQSCRECHQNPTSGGSSQINELRVGHHDAKGMFQNPDIPINNGTEMRSGAHLVRGVLTFRRSPPLAPDARRRFSYTHGRDPSPSRRSRRSH